MFPSASRSATISSEDFGNRGATGLIIVVDMTTDPGTDTVTFNVEGKDKASGKYFLILSSAPLSAVTISVLEIHPAIAPVANSAESALVPDVWRVTAQHSGSTPAVYSVGAILTV